MSSVTFRPFTDYESQVVRRLLEEDFPGKDALTLQAEVTSTTQVTDGHSYTVSNYGYDLAGHLTSQTYLSGRTITTTYDTAGRINAVAGQLPQQAVKTYADTFGYMPHGAVAAMKFGASSPRWEHTSFNSRLQPTLIGIGTNSTTDSSLLKLEYDYTATNNNGNVRQEKITIGTTVFTQDYGYDALNRLHTAIETLPGSSWSQTYDYDRWGNRWVSANIGYPLNTAMTPQSQSEIDPATNRFIPGQMPVAGFSYDAAGNLDGDPTTGTNKISYDAENHQTSYNNGAATYVYDGEGRRVKKVVAGSPSVTTIYVYNAAGQMIAEYKDQPTGTPVGTQFVAADHLGSTRMLMNASGTAAARYDYLPFGEEIPSNVGGRSSIVGYNPTATINQKFTQKERDSESGLDYFLARYYSSAQGRFTSPDEFAGGPDELFDFADDASDNPTFYADIYEPQSVNKYQYCYNNPLAYVDPDGHGVRFKRKNAPGGSATVLGAALTEAAQSPIPNPAVGAAFIVVGIGAMILDWWTHRSDQDSDSKDKSGPPPASDAQTQPQTQTQPAAPPGGGKDSRKVNRKREQSAKEKAEELKTQRDELRSKPNKTPEDKINLQKIESALKKQLERVKKSEPHSRRPKGYRDIVPVTDAKTKDDQLR